jgi:nucleotide-binding universal stress UspA family protein
MKNEIIVLIDTNDLDGNLSQYAIDFAKQINARVTFCDIVTTQKIPIDSTQLVYGTAAEMPAYENRAEKIAAEVESSLQSLCKKHAEEWGFIDYEVLVGVNYIQSVKKIIKERKPTLLMMSKSKPSSFWDEWLGTKATFIAEAINTPTLIIPKNQRFNAYKNMLHLLDLEGNDMVKLNQSLILAEQMNAKASAVYIEEKGNQNKDLFEKRTKMLSRLARYPGLTFAYYESNDFNETINTLIQEKNLDIIGIAYQNINFLSRLFTDNYAEKIIFSNDIPFIVY